MLMLCSRSAHALLILRCAMLCCAALRLNATITFAITITITHTHYHGHYHYHYYCYCYCYYFYFLLLLLRLLCYTSTMIHCTDIILSTLQYTYHPILHHKQHNTTLRHEIMFCEWWALTCSTLKRRNSILLRDCSSMRWVIVIGQGQRWS